MRALLAGLLVMAIAAPCAAAAGGVLVATPRFVPAAGPVVAGGGLAWVTRRDDRVLDLWVAEAGRGPRRVQRFSGADVERLRSPRLSASATAVGLALRVTDDRGTTIRRYAGPFGAPLAPAAALPGTRSGAGVVVTRGCESAEIRRLAHAGDAPWPAIGGALARPAAGDAPWPAAGGPLAGTAGGEPACELRLRVAPRLRAGRLRLGISCAGFEIDCSADVRVRARGRVVARGRARYNHTTPPYAAASLRVDRRLIAPGMRVRVTARIDGAVTRTTTAQLPAARR